MSAKLTAARCEALAALCARRGDDREAEVYTLAARALKARERAESRREAYPLASDTRTEIAILLAILDGREP